MNDKGQVTVSEYEFHARLDACLSDRNWSTSTTSTITVPPPPSRVNRPHRKDLYNLVSCDFILSWKYSRTRIVGGKMFHQE